eukprot:7039686-Alexandrium_andersonii.AAC.1
MPVALRGSESASIGPLSQTHVHEYKRGHRRGHAEKPNNSNILTDMQRCMRAAMPACRHLATIP